jgi:uncharacterized protein RhaS with RHS repeats
LIKCLSGLIKHTQQSANFFYHYDHNGDVIKLTNAQGSEVADLYYSAYGKTLSGDNPTPFGFSTKRMMNSGLIYYGYRYYMPHLGI